LIQAPPLPNHHPPPPQNTHQVAVSNSVDALFGVRLACMPVLLCKRIPILWRPFPLTQ
jgi:hypothetical protein